MVSDILTSQPKEAGHPYHGRNQLATSMHKSTHRVGQSREFIERHFNQRIKIPALAAQANLSISHFFKLFRQDTGCAPLVYLTRLRMDRACDLLKTTEWSIKLIAANLGYHDPLYFSRVFKSLIGVAPLTFRRANQDIRPRSISENVTAA